MPRSPPRARPRPLRTAVRGLSPRCFLLRPGVRTLAPRGIHVQGPRGESMPGTARRGRGPWAVGRGRRARTLSRDRHEQGGVGRAGGIARGIAGRTSPPGGGHTSGTAGTRSPARAPSSQGTARAAGACSMQGRGPQATPGRHGSLRPGGRHPMRPTRPRPCRVRSAVPPGARCARPLRVSRRQGTPWCRGPGCHGPGCHGLGCRGLGPRRTRGPVRWARG